MKKLLISAIALLLVFSVQSSAQIKFGITGGMNFNTSKFTDIDVKAKAGWNAGVTLLVDLPLGFSLQPSLVYSQKGVNLTDNVSQNMGYMELPVSVQWGPDLLIFRPFVDVTPFVGYAVTNNLKGEVANWSVSGRTWENKERFSYGLGLGGGINVWKFQVLVRYFWNFGKLYGDESWDVIKDNISNVMSDLADSNPNADNFGGLTIGLSFLF